MKTEEDFKKAFAAALLECPDEPFKAALELFPDDTAFAFQIANKWPLDSIVIAHKKELQGDEEFQTSLLLTKTELFKNVELRLKRINDPETYVKLAKSYSDMRGFTPKQEQQVNVSVVTNKVMVVKDHGTNDEWEIKLMQQQTDLCNGRYSTAN